MSTSYLLAKIDSLQHENVRLRKELEMRVADSRIANIGLKSQLDRIEGRLDGIAEGIRTIACVRATPCKKYKPVK